MSSLKLNQRWPGNGRLLEAWSGFQGGRYQLVSSPLSAVPQPFLSSPAEKNPALFSLF